MILYTPKISIRITFIAKFSNTKNLSWLFGPLAQKTTEDILQYRNSAREYYINVQHFYMYGCGID